LTIANVIGLQVNWLSLLKGKIRVISHVPVTILVLFRNDLNDFVLIFELQLTQALRLVCEGTRLL